MIVEFVTEFSKLSHYYESITFIDSMAVKIGAGNQGQWQFNMLPITNRRAAKISWISLIRQHHESAWTVTNRVSNQEWPS